MFYSWLCVWAHPLFIYRAITQYSALCQMNRLVKQTNLSLYFFSSCFSSVSFNIVPINFSTAAIKAAKERASAVYSKIELVLVWQNIRNSTGTWLFFFCFVRKIGVRYVLYWDFVSLVCFLIGLSTKLTACIAHLPDRSMGLSNDHFLRVNVVLLY